jgi:hypothetical protein
MDNMTSTSHLQIPLFIEHNRQGSYFTIPININAVIMQKYPLTTAFLPPVLRSILLI